MATQVLSESTLTTNDVLWPPYKVSVSPVPIVTIFVRHGHRCPHEDEFWKQCKCWKHLRWSHHGKQYRKATKSRTWAGAERVKREVELSYGCAAEGNPSLKKDEATSAWDAVQIFLQDKRWHNMGPTTLKKYRRELSRFAEFCDRQGRYFPKDVQLADLTAFRSAWEDA